MVAFTLNYFQNNYIYKKNQNPNYTTLINYYKQANNQLPPFWLYLSVSLSICVSIKIA